MNNNRLRAQNVGQPVLFLHCTRSGGISQPALCSPSGGYGCTRAGLRCGGGHAASRRRECATKNSGASGENGEISRKIGDFCGKKWGVFHRWAASACCTSGGMMAALRQRGKERRESCGTRDRTTQKSPEDCGMSRSSGRNVGACRRNKRQALRVYAYLFSSVVGALSMRSRN